MKEVKPVTRLTKAYSLGYDERCVWVFKTPRGGEPRVVGYFGDLCAALRYVLRQGVQGSRAKEVQGLLKALEIAHGECKAWAGVRAEHLKKALDSSGEKGNLQA